MTELGLPHIIRSDNGPCYNSKEFQQLLQHYNITHHTSSPHHPRSNGFVERMVGVVKKLMDKAGSEGKPWISGLYEYRVTPQSGSIASPLQLITQRTPREKDLPQLLSSLGAQEMYETHQELIRRQQNKPEKNYIELTPVSAILQKIYHRILFNRPHWTLKLLLLLILNQRKGRKLQMYLHLHLHLHWRQLRNKVLTLQDPESQQERTLESQPVHLVIFTCK